MRAQSCTISLVACALTRLRHPEIARGTNRAQARLGSTVSDDPGKAPPPHVQPHSAASSIAAQHHFTQKHTRRANRQRQPRDSWKRTSNAADTPHQPPSQPPSHVAACHGRCGAGAGPDRSRPRERARACERRLAQLRFARRSAPVARAARALAVRAPAAIASAAAAERGGVEEEAILRAVVGRRSVPMGSACSFSSRGAHLQPETGRGTRV